MLFDAVPQTSAIEVGVDLGGVEVIVSQNFLYSPDIHAVLQH